jgi:hypothetical protein
MRHTRLSILAWAAKAALVAMAMMVLGGSARADLVAAWDFNPLPGGSGNFGPSPYAATANDAHVATGGLTGGFDILGTGTGAATAWGSNNWSISANSEALAISANDFATFTVSAAPDYTLSLSDIPAYNIRRSGTGPSTGIWQYKIDGGSFVDIGVPITWGSVTTASGNPQSAISLSGISALQNVPGGTTVTFRVVNWGASSTSGTWYLNDPQKTSANDLVVNGTVAAAPVPEPGTLALFGVGLAVTMVTVARRKIRK